MYIHLTGSPWLGREEMERDISQQQDLSSSSSKIPCSSKEREKKQRVENRSPKCRGLGKPGGRMLLPPRDSSLSCSALDYLQRRNMDVKQEEERGA